MKQGYIAGWNAAVNGFNECHHTRLDKYLQGLEQVVFDTALDNMADDYHDGTRDALQALRSGRVVGLIEGAA